MPEPVQITLAVEDDVPAKLAELAGGEAQSGQFLTEFVRLLYAVQKTPEEKIDFGRILARHKENEEIIRMLRTRLGSMNKTQEELLASVKFLIAALSESSLPSKRKPN
jgi:hypothetical protein